MQSSAAEGVFLSELSQAIRQIRERLGANTTEFGNLIGANQSTVSRYELGRTIPGYIHLGALLQIAEGTEKNPILDALQHKLGVNGEQQVLDELSRMGRLRKLGQDDFYAWLELKELERFSGLAEKVLVKRKEVDPSLNAILDLWLSSETSDPRVRRCFADAANYLKVCLSVKGE
jgi:transcriptional regulator with XRE-family HTH domain